MARLTAPLLSLGASGSIAKSLVFANWKGINYARVHVIPENPNTVDQQEVRGVFATLAEMYKRMPTGARVPWIAAVRGLALTARNRHVQANLAALKGQAVLDDLVMSIASGQAIAPDAALAVDGADGTVTWTCIAPTAPVGYTLVGVSGVACLDGDPSPVLVRPTYFGTIAAAPWAGVIDVPADGDYQVGLFAIWERDADGQLFYSEAVRNQVTVTGS